MKKTENISLSGYAFTIEIDAYEDLNTYLNDIREAFIGDASADEIVADIEERIAELLREKYIDGMVVDLSMIKEIRKRIGNPKELAQGDNSPAEESIRQPAEEVRDTKKSWKNRKMYRNMDERILGGVCSGLGTYFGIDKVIFRLIFLILFFIGFADDGLFCIPMIAYVCLWIAMPAARTAEQKREMKGRPLNLDSYRSRDFDFGNEVRDVAQSPAGQTAKRAGGVFLGILLLVIGLGGLLCSIMIPAMPTLMNAFMTEITPIDTQLVDILTLRTFWYLVFVMSCIMFVWFIYNGVMMLFDLKYPSWRPGLVLLIAWIISIFAIFAWFIKTAAFDFPSLLFRII